MPSSARYTARLAAYAAVALAAAGGAAAWRMHAAREVVAPPVRAEDGDIVLGPDHAPVSVLALVSLTCSHCREWEMQDLPSVERSLTGTGRIRLIIRQFPLDRRAALGAALVRCLPPPDRLAAEAKLMAAQDVWSAARTDADALRSAAKEIGVPPQEAGAAAACAAARSTLEKVAEAEAEAERLYQVQGTPTFVISPHVYLGGLSEQQLARLASGNGDPRH